MVIGNGLCKLTLAFLVLNKNIARVHNGYVPLSYRLTKVFFGLKTAISKL